MSRTSVHIEDTDTGRDTVGAREAMCAESMDIPGGHLVDIRVHRPWTSRTITQSSERGLTSMDAKHAAKARALGRAKTCAWIVAISMAAMTMTFQVYHSIKFGQMPWPLAILEGIGPLALSMLILEIAAEWEHARWACAAAYVIMGGAMYMSAAATGSVVLHAAPAHMSWLFGALLDGAALLAVHFILNGPSAADVAREAEAEGAARAKLEESLRAEASELRAELEAANAARKEAEWQRAGAEASARKLAAATARKRAGNPGRKQTRKPAPATGRKDTETTAPVAADATADLDSEALVLKYLSEGKSASEAGRLAGLSDARGRQIARKLAKAAPADAVDGNQGHGES